MRKILPVLMLLMMGMAANIHAKSLPRAVEGVNYTVSNSTTIHYMFILPVTGKVTISTKGLTVNHVGINVQDESLKDLRSDEGIEIELSFTGSKNDTFYINILGGGIVPWSLTVTSGDFPGTSCSKPAPAVRGLNDADNSNGSQWFSFTPVSDGSLTISTCGLTTEDTYIEIYGKCDSSNLAENDDDCDFQSQITIDVTAGQTYLIKWRDEYTHSTFKWNLDYAPNTNANITYFNLYDDNLVKYVISRPVVIDTTANTITAWVSKNTDLVSYSTAIFDVSMYANMSLDYPWFLNGYEYYYDYQDFTNPVNYSVDAGDGITTKEWTVTIHKESTLQSGNQIINYVIDDETAVIDDVNHTVKVSVNAMDLSSLYYEFLISPGASLYFKGGSEIFSENYENYSDTLKLTLVSEDSSSIQDWDVIVSTKKGLNCDSAQSINLGTVYGNGNNYQYFKFTPVTSEIITVSNPDTSEYGYYVIVDTGDCGSLTEITSNEVYPGHQLYFRADSGRTYTIYTNELHGKPLNLSHNNISKEISDFEVIDGFGNFVAGDIDTVNNTITLQVSYNTYLEDLYFELNLTNNQFLSASVNGSLVCDFGSGSGDGEADFSDPVTINITASDSSKAVYTVLITKKAALKGNSILAFSLQGQTSGPVIDPVARTVKAGVDTSIYDITDLSANFLLSIGAYATDTNDDVIIPGSYLNFSDTVIFNVYSEDSTLAQWKIIVSQGDTILNNEANVVAYHLGILDEKIMIDEQTGSITAAVPVGSDVSDIAAIFTLSRGAKALVGSTEQSSGITSNDFTSLVDYTVVAEDGITSKDWTVNVREISTATDITSFSLAGQTSANINAASHTISVLVPHGTNVSNLTATFTLSTGATVKVGATDQVSGTTTNNFSSAVTYIVTAEDGTTTQNWAVTVSVISGIEKLHTISVSTYPNPSNGRFYILSNSNIDNAKVSVTDITGKLVLLRTFYLKNGESQALNLNVTAGTYILNIVSGNSKYQQLILIK
jgi:hypothetical protein